MFKIQKVKSISARLKAEEISRGKRKEVSENSF